jgi:hypothetical protein
MPWNMTAPLVQQKSLPSIDTAPRRVTRRLVPAAGGVLTFLLLGATGCPPPSGDFVDAGQHEDATPGDERPCLDCGPLKFAPAVRYPILGPERMVAADVDADGRPDIVVPGATGRPQERVLHLFLNRGDGSFSRPPPLSHPGLELGFGFRMADLDSDGRPDIIAGFSTILWNRGGGQFAGPVEMTWVDSRSPPAMPAPRAAENDLDEDGRTDLLWGGCCFEFDVLFNQGGGRFFRKKLKPFVPPKPPYYGGIGAFPVRDLDGDGHWDLAGFLELENTTFVLFGDGKGGFDGPYTRATSTVGQRQSPASMMREADLDGDGRSDLIVGAHNGLDVLLSRGGRADRGTFTNYDLGRAGNVATGDLNGDGRTDVVMEAYGQAFQPPRWQGGVLILLNQGGGKLQPSQIFAVTAMNRSVAGLVVADFDGDGRMDIAVDHTLADDGTGALDVFFNRTP